MSKARQDAILPLLSGFASHLKLSTRAHVCRSAFTHHDSYFAAHLPVDSQSVQTSRTKALSSQTIPQWQSLSAKTRDVVGIGEAMVDFSAYVSEAFLQEVGLTKGGRKILSLREMLRVQDLLDDRLVKQPGSSVTNTLVALRQLSRASSRDFRLGLIGCIGSDVLGQFYSSHLDIHEIESFDCEMERKNEQLTGCVIVLTTSDAQRSFLVYPGQGRLRLSKEANLSIASSRVLLVEGYLLGLEGTAHEIKRAIKCAKENETFVALTAGADDVIRSKRTEFWEVINTGVDLFLCNQNEAAALLDEKCCAFESVEKLKKKFPMVAVTDGSNGSYIAALEQRQTVPPVWTKDSPVDTCGAGDVYAAGLLFGLLSGHDLHSIGLIAARSASAIITKQGSLLSFEDAETVVRDLTQTVDSNQVEPRLLRA